MNIFFCIRTIFVCAILLCSAPSSSEPLAEHVSIQGLQQQSYEAELILEKDIGVNKKYQSSLMSYQSNNLKQFTLVNTPNSLQPEAGFPVLIFGHGFHPTPEKYGISNKSGLDSRPGDYYRGIPESYAAQGFLTLTPDYRGHNKSEGLEFTKTSYLTTSYYASDVLHLLAALESLQNADLNNVFYMGHSMGGDVGLKALLASNNIKAASLWAPSSAPAEQRAIYYGIQNIKDGLITAQQIKAIIDKVSKAYQKLSIDLTSVDVDPIHHIHSISAPIIIHHSRGDRSVPYAWSEVLISKLYEFNKAFEFFPYNSNNHLFKGENKALAVERDIVFFKKYFNK